MPGLNTNLPFVNSPADNGCPCKTTFDPIKALKMLL